MKKLANIRRQRKLQRRGGSSLLGAIIFLFIGFSVSSIVLMNAVHQNRMVLSQVNIERAHFAAEAGLEAAASYIQKMGDTYFPGTTSPTVTLTNQVNGGAYTYTITREGFREYSVRSIGEYRGARRVVSVDRVRDKSFAEFALWTADFRNGWMIPGQVTDGKVHSDTSINIFGSNGNPGPVYWGKVTSLEPFNKDWPGVGGPEFATFHAGYEIPSDQGSLAEINFSEMQNEAIFSPDGMVLSGDTIIDFDFNEGSGLESLIVSNENYFGDTDFHRVDLSVKNLIYVKDSVGDSKGVQLGGAVSNGDIVSGVPVVNAGFISGRVTIYTEEDVTIRDELKYRHDPSTNPTSLDALGVVSMDDVWIDIPARPANDPDVLLVGAYLAAGARHPEGAADGPGNIGVVGWDDLSAGPKGEIIRYGASIMDQIAFYGIADVWGSGALLSGFHKSAVFDKRFLEEPPPYFPGPEQLRFANWRYATLD